VLSLAALFIIQESLFRYLFPVPEVLFNRAAYMPAKFSTEISETRAKALCNVIVRWEFEPDGVSFDHTLNLYGFRGPDFPIKPAADRPRILFVGDSFVEGCGASDDDTLPRQFANLIGTQSAEVINLGVAAANFPEYLRLMLDAVPLLRPHTVFLVACSNDLPALPPFDSPVPPPGGLAALDQRDFTFLSPWQPRAAVAVSLLHEGWSLPFRVHRGPFGFFAPVPDPSNPLSSTRPVEGLDPVLERAMRAGKANPHLQGKLPVFDRNLCRDYEKAGGAANLLRFLTWFCGEYGARLLVIYVPFHVAANPAYLPAQVKLGGCAGFALPASFSDEAHRSQQRHLARECREAGLTFIDSTDTFIAGERRQRLFWPTDGHCNAEGYRLLAELCAERWSTIPQGVALGWHVAPLRGSGAGGRLRPFYFPILPSSRTSAVATTWWPAAER
jgi:lysophospholipase L1-like esterase